MNLYKSDKRNLWIGIAPEKRGFFCRHFKGAGIVALFWCIGFSYTYDKG